MGEKMNKEQVTTPVVADIEKAEIPVFGKRDTASYNKLKNNIEKVSQKQVLHM